MKKLGLKGRQWLKGFHLFFAGCWVAAGFSLILLGMFLKADNGGMLYGFDIARKFIDDFIIIPAAIGSLLTGLIYSIWTGWGFFKHNWIIVKYVVTIGGILFGTFFLGPWLNGMPPISKELGLKALSDPVYVHNAAMNQWWSLVQVGSLVVAVFISTLKPWKKKTKKEA